MKAFLIILSSVFSLMLSAGNLSAYLYLAQFNSPEKGSYIECYLNVIGNSVAYAKSPEGTFQANLEVLYLFKQSNQIKAFEKYQLNSPVIRDSISSIPNFTNVQRILLPKGVYNFEVKIRDLNDTNNVFSYKSIISVDFDKEHQFSDIELVESYRNTQEPNVLTKGDVDIVPYVSSFFSTELEALNFYVELYNKNEGEDFLIHYYIESSKNAKPLGQYSRFKRFKSAKVNPFLSGFDIKELPTGNYNLVLALKDRNNQLLTDKRFFFQRYNASIQDVPDTVRLSSFVLADIASIESVEKIADYIKSAIPIYSQRELFKANNVLKSGDLELMKTFFNNFWASYSSKPEEDWAIYKQNVELVNRSYPSLIKKGYETERGRVYLKYGTPSEINRSNHEPSSYPYEIWHYFELNGETDIRFVFYNPDMVGKDYLLLHSNLTGERNNPYWQRDLTRRNNTNPSDLNSPKGHSQYGNRAGEVFRR